MTARWASDFSSGVLFWLKGWKYLFQHRSLLLVAIMPLLISIAVTSGLVYILWSYMPKWLWSFITWFGGSYGRWQNILYYPLLVSGALVILIAAVYVMYLLQSLVAVPFFTVLADRALGQLGKKPEDSKMWKEWVAHSLKMIRVSILKTVLLLLIGVFLFAFSFMPVLNLAALAGALLILALDCMDYTLEALGFGFRQRMAYFFRQWPQWFGMAVGLALTLVIPGLTLLVIPGAIVGAAIIVKNQPVDS